uniref:Uncharacterized protein n=1 Tax=Candidatus Kentrum sp. LFY TaxID=2126342 RepID=A0A450U8Q9_9GAMM|nr:MAG: hypothetical protein BECKLFY1418B_GA0070995_101012 [Candidatus Kentron sp. LFY]
MSKWIAQRDRLRGFRVANEDRMCFRLLCDIRAWDRPATETAWVFFIDPRQESILGVGSRIPTVSENSTHLHGTYITNAPVAIFSTDPGNHRGNMEGIRVSTIIILAPRGRYRRRGRSFIHANTRFGLNPSRYSFISRSASRMRQVLQKPVLRCQIPNHALSDTAALFVIALLFCAILAYGALEAG